MINAIACVDMNNAIGFQNKLLFNIKSDMKRFVELTTGHSVVMGRKTFESIGKPLKNRLNFVLTKNPESLIGIEGIVPITDIDVILKYNLMYPSNQIFVIGGEEVYKQFEKHYSKIYLTKVLSKSELADTYFIDIDKEIWNVEESDMFDTNEELEDDHRFVTITYSRK